MAETILCCGGLSRAFSVGRGSLVKWPPCLNSFSRVCLMGSQVWRLGALEYRFPALSRMRINRS